MPETPDVRIPVYVPYLRGREAEYVRQCVDSGWVSSKGDFVQRFERDFEAYLGMEAATSVANGTVALHLALHTLGVGEGDEVIVPSFTYIASVNAIRFVGATPVFVDSLPDTWNLDPDQLASRLTRRTRAVLAVHLYGGACALDEIKSFTRAHGLHLVEDAAEAFGTRYRDGYAGAWGDLSTFSFFGNKTITTGEGGMVASRDTAIVERAAYLKSQAVSPEREYWHAEVGFNFRMTNLCAALGVAQLEQADEILARKRAIARRYMDGLEGLPVRFQADLPDTENSYWMVSVVTDDQASREGVRRHLAAAGVETRPFFHPAHVMPAFRSDESLPVAESISVRGLNLPSSPVLTDEEVDFVVQQVREYFHER